MNEKKVEYIVKPRIADKVSLFAAVALTRISKFLDRSSCRLMLGILRRHIPVGDYDELFGEDSDE